MAINQFCSFFFFSFAEYRNFSYFMYLFFLLSNASVSSVDLGSFQQPAISQNLFAKHSLNNNQMRYWEIIVQV